MTKKKRKIINCQLICKWVPEADSKEEEICSLKPGQTEGEISFLSRNADVLNSDTMKQEILKKKIASSFSHSRFICAGKFTSGEKKMYETRLEIRENTHTRAHTAERVNYSRNANYYKYI